MRQSTCLVVFKHFQQVGLFHLQTFKWLLLLDYLFADVVEDFEIAFADAIFLREEVVVKSTFYRRPVTEVAAINALHCLSEDVGRGMPEYSLNFNWQISP